MADDAARSRVRLWLASGAAAVGLALGLLGALTADPLAEWGGGGGIVATVNGAVITEGDYALAVETLASGKRNVLTDEDRARVLDLLINEELLVQRGVEIGLIDTDRTVRKTLANAMIASVMADASRGEPTEEELRAFYEAQPAVFSGTGRLQVARIFLADGPEQQAQEEALKKGLADGVPFSSLAARFNPPSVQPLPDQPLPLHKLREYVGPTLAAKAEGMAPGDIAGPVRAFGGLNYLLLVVREDAAPRPFEEVRALVAAAYARQQDDAALDAYFEWLRERADVRVLDGNET